MQGPCANHSLPCVGTQFATAADFRTNFAALRAMGAVKVGCFGLLLEGSAASLDGLTRCAALSLSSPLLPCTRQVQLVLEILERHPQLSLLAVSNSDTVATPALDLL